MMLRTAVLAVSVVTALIGAALMLQRVDGGPQLLAGSSSPVLVDR